MLNEEDLLKDIWRNSPTYAHLNIRKHDEQRIRVYLSETLQKAGVFLKLPQPAIATAQHICHRFYFRESIGARDYKLVLPACVLISIKLHEVPRVLREILSVFDQIWLIYEGYKRPVLPLDLNTQSYQDLKSDTIHIEQVILRELGYHLFKLTHLPHSYILNYVEMLGGDRNLAQTAWNYINDSFRTALCVSHLPHVIATSAIYLAARKLKLELGNLDLPWWEIFQTSWEELNEVCKEMESLYDNPVLCYEEVRDILNHHRNNRHKQKHKRHRSRSSSRHKKHKRKH